METANRTADDCELVPARDDHVAALMGWFDSAMSVARWAGPPMRYPLEHDTFLADLHWGEWDSYALIDGDGDGALRGFGQLYVKLGRCHLARIAVAPDARGRGVGRTLIRRLMAIGRERHRTREWSLYVLDDNLPAVACYRACGFVLAPDPNGAPILPGCVFMVAPAGALDP